MLLLFLLELPLFVFADVNVDAAADVLVDAAVGLAVAVSRERAETKGET